MAKQDEVKKQDEDLNYALDLFETVTAEMKSETSILAIGLRIMEFGKITPKQMLDYLEATGR